MTETASSMSKADTSITGDQFQSIDSAIEAVKAVNGACLFDFVVTTGRVSRGVPTTKGRRRDCTEKCRGTYERGGPQ